jgi:hypothetical protein
VHFPSTVFKGISKRMRKMIFTLLLSMALVSVSMTFAQSQPTSDKNHKLIGLGNGTALASFDEANATSFTFQRSSDTAGGNFMLNSGDRTSPLLVSVTDPFSLGNAVFRFDSADSAKLRTLREIECSTRIDNCAHRNLIEGGIGDPDSDRWYHHRLMLAPEPTAGLLLGTGLLVAGTMLRRRGRLLTSRTETEA